MLRYREKAHRRFYCSQRLTLNITRQDMIRAGYSPSVRLFEAAACGAPILSDWWTGLDTFFKPDEEILIARSTREVVRHLQALTSSSGRNWPKPRDHACSTSTRGSTGRLKWNSIVRPCERGARMAGSGRSRKPWPPFPRPVFPEHPIMSHCAAVEFSHDVIREKNNRP